MKPDKQANQPVAEVYRYEQLPYATLVQEQEQIRQDLQALQIVELKATLEECRRVLEPLKEISERANTQDNRFTAEPMFCVQVKVRELNEWEDFGYKDRWEAVMVTFTEEGCKQYLRANGHNHHGETRIYAKSFYRCREMIEIRKMLLSAATLLAKLTP